MVHDKDQRVKEQVIRHGYGVDILINDKDPYIRTRIFENGYCLDKAVFSENRLDRSYAAKAGYGLDILINDKEPFVREEVAARGYGIDKLINDRDKGVKITAQKYLYTQGLTLQQWIDLQNPTPEKAPVDPKVENILRAVSTNPAVQQDMAKIRTNLNEPEPER